MVALAAEEGADGVPAPGGAGGAGGQRHVALEVVVPGRVAVAAQVHLFGGRVQDAAVQDLQRRFGALGFGMGLGGAEAVVSAVRQRIGGCGRHVRGARLPQHQQLRVGARVGADGAQQGAEAAAMRWRVRAEDGGRGGSGLWSGRGGGGGGGGGGRALLRLLLMVMEERGGGSPHGDWRVLSASPEQSKGPPGGAAGPRGQREVGRIVQGFHCSWMG